MADTENKSSAKMLSGTCPDPECQTKLFFPIYDVSIECNNCGQRHDQSKLTNIEEVTDTDVAVHNLLKMILLKSTKPQKGPENVKVFGLSNYQCKLLSPLLSNYGMDKQGNGLLLRDMGQGDTFDCSKLGDRAFLLEPDFIDVVGYGRDRTGSGQYLKQTLDAIHKNNRNEERLVPIHTDGDGHCLVHAISRALVGRELFWDALHQNLWKHFTDNLEKYMSLFGDFVDKTEWRDIVAECDPQYVPTNGEPLGLRNIHIFGLANVLRRPIILLDSISGIQNIGDYSGIFLPSLCPPESCRGKNGQLRKPLCIAWSSSARNHYIALVGVKGRPLPVIPSWMLPKPWGMNKELVKHYIDFNEQGGVVIGGDKCLQVSYIQRLVRAMEDIFLSKYGVSPSLVSDVNQCIYRTSGMIGMKPELVLAATHEYIIQKSLFRCITCEAVKVHSIGQAELRPLGSLYELATQNHGKLDSSKMYSFPTHGFVCSFDAENDELIPIMSMSSPLSCTWCKGTQLRHVNGDGSCQYKNKDRTLTQAPNSRCQCGYMHYWDGKEYENLPQILPVSLEWNGKVLSENVAWFQYESDPTRNSNVYEVAQNVVQKHFPGEFGSEVLVKKVVDTILYLTQSVGDPKQDGQLETGSCSSNHEDTDTSWRSNEASKIILIGQKSKTLHKEELTMSNKEKSIKKNIEEKAPIDQQKKSRISLNQHELPSSTSETATSTLAKSKPDSSDLNRVRVSVSGGVQKVLSLPKRTTYYQLQDILEGEFGIPKSSQIIKYGFPPKECSPPGVGNEDKTIPIQHGDRITLDMATDKTAKLCPTGVPVPTANMSDNQNQSLRGSNDSNILLEKLKELQSAPVDNLDMTIQSLSLMATISGRDLWSLVQTMPHLFTKGGLYYQQIVRDIGLVDGKHFTLPTLPGKTFRYNGTKDLIDLCLEPQGHFIIQPNMEKEIARERDTDDESSNSYMSAAAIASTFGNLHGENSEDLKKILSSGSLNVQANPHIKMPHIPFSGQGHSLTSMKSRDTQDGGHSSRNIRRETQMEGDERVAHVLTCQEKQDDMETDEDTPVAFKRVGPGMTVIDHEAINRTNKHAESLKRLTSSLQSTIEQNMLCSSDEEDTKEATSF